MKLVQYRAVGAELPGILGRAGRERAFSAAAEDTAGAALLPESPAHLAGTDRPGTQPQRARQG